MLKFRINRPITRTVAHSRARNPIEMDMMHAIPSRSMTTCEDMRFPYKVQFHDFFKNFISLLPNTCNSLSSTIFTTAFRSKPTIEPWVRFWRRAQQFHVYPVGICKVGEASSYREPRLSKIRSHVIDPGLDENLYFWSSRQPRSNETTFSSWETWLRLELGVSEKNVLFGLIKTFAKTEIFLQVFSSNQAHVANVWWVERLLPVCGPQTRVAGTEMRHTWSNRIFF